MLIYIFYLWCDSLIYSMDMYWWNYTFVQIKGTDIIAVMQAVYIWLAVVLILVWQEQRMYCECLIFHIIT